MFYLMIQYLHDLLSTIHKLKLSDLRHPLVVIFTECLLIQFDHIHTFTAITMVLVYFTDLI